MYHACALLLVAVSTCTISNAANVISGAVNTSSPFNISATFLSTTIDIATFVDHDHCDFNNVTLRSMVRSLYCAHIRVGGTQGDFTFYNNFPFSLANVTSPLQLPPHFKRVFEYRQWRELLQFVTAVGLRMYFGLNAGYGGDNLVRTLYELGGDWVGTMSEWLLRDAVAFSSENNLTVSPVEAFEFSNEPNLFPFGGEMKNSTLAWSLNGTKLAKDLSTVRSVVSQFDNTWKVVCCDVAYVPLIGEIDAFMAEFTNAGGVEKVDELTFHFYPLFSSSFNKSLPPSLDPLYASVTKVLDPQVLDQVGYWADRFHSDALRSGAPPSSLRIILGETGSAVGGGQDGLSNAFADVIEYVDKIGQMTARGHDKMFRQTLCGSPDQYYALIAHDLTPSPSYFATALLNRFVFQSDLASGSRLQALHVSIPLPTIRAYSFLTSSPLRSGTTKQDYVMVMVTDLNATATSSVLQLNIDSLSLDVNGTALRLSMSSSANGTVDEVLSSMSLSVGTYAKMEMRWDAATASIAPPIEGSTGDSLLERVSASALIQQARGGTNEWLVTISMVPLQWQLIWLPLVK